MEEDLIRILAGWLLQGRVRVGRAGGERPPELEVFLYFETVAAAAVFLQQNYAMPPPHPAWSAV